MRAPGHLFVLGYGYTASVLGARLLDERWRVSGTRRSAQGVAELSDRGVSGHVFPATAGANATHSLHDVLARASHLLVSIPPGPDGDPALLELEAALRRAGRFQWVGLLSTTGVYGDWGGGWVDESCEPAPGSPSTVRRLEAEGEWALLCRALGAPLQVFRLPGIYGPGRSPVDALRNGTARRIVKPGQVFNRMHVADIAGVVRAGMARPHLPGVFNLSDDLPSPQEDPVLHAAELLGVDPPPARSPEDAGLGPMGMRFFSESRVVANDRIKAALAYRLRYPTFREGLAAIARGAGAGEGGPIQPPESAPTRN